MTLCASEADFGALEREIESAVNSGGPGAEIDLIDSAAERFPGDPAWRILLGELYFEADFFSKALAEFERANALNETNSYARAMAGACRLSLNDIDGAEARLEAALSLDRRNPDAQYWRGVLLDIQGQTHAASTCYRLAAREAPEEYFVPHRVSNHEFLVLVEDAMEALEERYPGFRVALSERNVEVSVQEMPTPSQVTQEGLAPTLLGVFHGHTALDRSLEDPWSALPGYIILFQRNIERECRDEDELYEQIYITLLHEAAHAHGRGEEWMEERGLQ